MAVAVHHFYNRIACVYGAIDFFLKPQRKVLVAEINTQPPGHLLEVGVGSGSNLALYKGHRITGIDTSAAMLKRAEKHKTPQTELWLMNGNHMQFKNASFDYVVLSHVIAVVDNPEQLLNEVLRVLKPGGKVFILNHFTPDNGLRYFDKALNKLARLFYFRSFFSIKNLKGIEKFKALKQTNLGMLGYFKLLILQKP